MRAGRGLRFAAVCLVAWSATSPAYGVTVFAAASLKNALEEIAGRYEGELILSFGGSSMLARQIEYGAPADIFISANSAWMDRLEQRNLLQARSRYDFVSNQLVLIGAKGQHDADPGLAALRATHSQNSRIAMALVDAVPAGIYGKAALQHLGYWRAVMPRVVQTDNVRAALMLVASGEAALGVVYATDVGTSDNVEVLGHFPEESYPAIRYPVAATHQASQEALGFLDFLSSKEVLALMRAHGFRLLER